MEKDETEPNEKIQHIIQTALVVGKGNYTAEVRNYVGRK